jgi:hypothetical protein
MYPVRNDAKHDKHRSQHPCDQSQISTSEDDVLPNYIVIEHDRPKPASKIICAFGACLVGLSLEAV